MFEQRKVVKLKWAGQDDHVEEVGSMIQPERSDDPKLWSPQTSNWKCSVEPET
jgi:hypothetical protein